LLQLQTGGLPRWNGTTHGDSLYHGE